MPGLTPLRLSLLASVAFHAAFCALAWRVRVPVPSVEARPLHLQLLPALGAPAPAEAPMAEPALQPEPPARPFLQPPPPKLDPAGPLPGPFPLEDPAADRLRARPVLPSGVDLRALGVGADPVPIAPRETPPPYLD